MNGIEQLFNIYKFVSVGKSDCTLRDAYEHGKRYVRQNDLYSLLINDCQFFASKLASHLCNDEKIKSVAARLFNIARMTNISSEDNHTNGNNNSNNSNINDNKTIGVSGDNSKESVSKLIDKTKVTIEMIKENIAKYDRYQDLNDRIQFYKYLESIKPITG